MTVAQMISRARCKAFLNQTQMAENCGVHRVTVCRWEHGKKMPSPESCLKLERVLGIPYRKLQRAIAAEELRALQD